MKRLLLAGGGHAHVFVLEALARTRPAGGVEVTLVTPFPRLFYSGMLPGWIAGHYALDDCAIPLAPLAERAGAKIAFAHLARLDLDARTAWTESAEPFPFDLISIDTGPVVDHDQLPGLREHAITVRPIESLIIEWQRLLAHWRESIDPQIFTVVGGGAGGVELALAVAHHGHAARFPLRVQLVAGHPGLVPSLPKPVASRVGEVLRDRDVRVLEDDVTEIARRTVMLADGGELTTDTTLVATGAAAAPWHAAAGLAVDERGFIAVNEYLQSQSHPFVFAAGDCATMIEHPRPKSGVYAVRAGPRLAANLLRALQDRQLRAWTPQTSALYLLSLGEKCALASRGSLRAEGRWAWRWKDRLDRAFVGRFK